MGTWIHACTLHPYEHANMYTHAYVLQTTPHAYTHKRLQTLMRMYTLTCTCIHSRCICMSYSHPILQYTVLPCILEAGVYVNIGC